MKIVHCLDHYMPLHMAGTELYVHTLASSQKRGGNEVAVLIPHFEYYQPGVFAGQYVYGGIDVYQYMEPSDPREKGFTAGRKAPDGLANFEAALRALRPDVVHFHELTRSIGLGVPHVKLAKRLGAKVILTMHLPTYTCNATTLVRNDRICSGEIREFDCSVCCQKTRYHFPPAVSWPIVGIGWLAARTGILSRLPEGKATTVLSFPATIRRIKAELVELAATVDRIVPLTAWYKKILVENGVPENKITVIPQALASAEASGPQAATAGAQPTAAGTSSAAPSALAASSAPEPPATVIPPLKIVYVGRIFPIKGVHLLIEAVKGYTRDQVIVDIFGKEEDTDYCRDCKRLAEKAESIQFRGQIQREKVLPTLPGYHLLCVPSTCAEMSPLVIQEAFAAGIPALVSDVYGNVEQVKHEVNGLVFDFNSAASLRTQIQRLIDNPHLVARLRQNVRPPGDFNAIDKAYWQLYTN
ncbi:glycosyltransferase [Puia sp.]|jgi:glycosyltransferase involved in cell wall biosynthesis|uniref:glycosyltransferase n=1 Tax=Puia sp. TaxID=2045100 RepID=UPI002F416CD0